MKRIIGLSIVGLALAGCVSPQEEIHVDCSSEPNDRQLWDEYAEAFSSSLAEVQVRFVEISQKTLDELGAKMFPRKGGGHRYDIADFEKVPAAALERRLIARRDLVRNESAKVLTRWGEEAMLKTVTEYTYPTDFDVQSGEYMRCSNTLSRVDSFGIATVEPQSFIMREVGLILDITPQLKERDGGRTVDLILQSQIVDPPEWSDFGMQLPNPNGGTYALPMKQPNFPVCSIDTRLSVALDKTVLAGSLVSARKPDSTQLIFLRVRKVNQKGKAVLTD